MALSFPPTGRETGRTAEEIDFDTYPDNSAVKTSEYILVLWDNQAMFSEIPMC